MLPGMAANDSEASPRDRFVTVYGRKPVLEALADRALDVDKVLLAEGARGEGAERITRAARDRGVPVRRASPHRIKVLAGNGKQDQGVLADVLAPRMRTLASALASDDPPGTVLLLDGITTQANVGMILRTATAAGIDGIVLPRRGVAGIDPLVIKASAGIAFHAPILRAGTARHAADELAGAGYPLFGLRAAAESLYCRALPPRAAFVLGSESEGVSAAVEERVGGWVSIPMSGGVESLNVASAAAVLCFELARRSAPVTRTGEAGT